MAPISPQAVVLRVLQSESTASEVRIDFGLDIEDEPGAESLLDACVRVANALGFSEITPELLIRVGLSVPASSPQMNRLQDQLRKLGYEPVRIPIQEEFEDHTYSELDYGVDLNKKMAANSADRPLVGRAPELEELQIELLAEKSVVLTGKPGVGKSALVEGLAWLIENAPGEVDDALRNFKFVSIQVADLVADSSLVGALETRLQEFKDHFSRKTETVVFIDEVHALFSGNKASGKTIADNLKPALERGAIQVIGASTVREYQQYFARDRALSERFQDILLEEPKPADAIDIIWTRGDNLLARRLREGGVSLTKDSVEEAVRLSRLHYEDALPRKPIKILKAAGARKFFYRTTSRSRSVEASDVREIVAKQLKVPSEILSAESDLQVRLLRERLEESLFGQAVAIDQICDGLILPLSGMTDPELPASIMSFAGPANSGMMEAARVIGELLCGNRDAVESLDLSDYADRTALHLLKGSPIGHVDSGEIETIFTKVRSRPHVLLFQNLSFLRPDVSSLISAMLSGRVKDNRNDITDFSKCVFIFVLDDQAPPSDAFAPIRSRIDEIVVFVPYSEEDLGELLTSVVNHRIEQNTIPKRFQRMTKQKRFRKRVINDAKKRGSDGESLRIALDAELKVAVKRSQSSK